MYYIAVILVLYLVYLRNSSGCNSYLYRTPVPQITMDVYGRSIICRSTGKDEDDMLEIMECSALDGKDITLGYTLNNFIEIQLNKNKTEVYCRIRDGYNNVLTTTKLHKFQADEETSTVTTATTLTTTPSEDVINVLPLQNETNLIDQPIESDSGSKLSSPMVIGGLVTIGILFVLILIGVIIYFRRRHLREISKDDMTAEHVVQYVQLELEPAVYPSRPFTKETPYAEIIGVVKKK